MVCLNLSLLPTAYTKIQTGGFSVSYFQAPWISRVGPGAVFGTQGAIVAFTIVVLITPTLLIGRKRASSEVRERVELGEKA